MYKTIFGFFLAMAFFLYSQPHRTTPREEMIKTSGTAAAHGAYHTVALSMMLWGAGLAVGIAAASAFLDFSDSSSSGGGGGNGGGGSHSH